ncbi:hypothetical protein KBY27_08190 [Ruegeria pomeroyi]|uniref:Uncharacterized protein n=1 Tax=Ruegeria pomeroyi TaxID=89184 RepID=A0A9Q3ZLW0_9RHOB|nr:hypothetical protein [Ruegeria pomeroyi]MCE8537433.1 hypothetical protein [Ruegeria pomeroyi]
MSDKVGVCALTGSEGSFVKAHILPRALTKPAKKDSHLLQSTRGRGYRKRFTSWYDKSLVIREGENILSRIDDRGVKALRKNMLVWSSWRAFKPYFEPMGVLFPDHSIRNINLEGADAIHEFFLSIAWRACASKMPDMEHAFASTEHIELMRQIVSGEVELKPINFPVSLTQISTFGEVHNFSPIRETVSPPKSISQYLENEEWDIIRIYMDGLVAHVHLQPERRTASEIPTFVSSSRKTAVTAVTFEASAQYERMLIGAWETKFPFGSLE